MNGFVFFALLICLVIINNVHSRGIRALKTDEFRPFLYLERTEDSTPTSEKKLTEEYWNNTKTAKDADKNFAVCIKSRVNIRELKREIKESKHKEEILMVLNKFCKTSPKIIECSVNYSNTVEKVMNDDEKLALKIFTNIKNATLSYFCQDDAFRAYLFEEARGSECVVNNRESIKRCVYTELNLHYDTPNIYDITKFKYDREHCKVLSNVQSCILDQLKTCNEPTIINLAESLLNSLRQLTPCSTHLKMERRTQELLTMPFL